jgi:putative drug exporter of the RND superfamily
MLTLFGRAVWWLPRWLSRRLPHVDIEGEAEPPAPEPAVQPRRPGPATATEHPP